MTPSWVVAQCLFAPNSPYGWDYGVTESQTARAWRVYDALLADGIPAKLDRVDTYPPGLWRLSFPVKHYQRVVAISDGIAD